MVYNKMDFKQEDEKMQKIDLNDKIIFVTGVAGFIGSNLSKKILKEFNVKKVIGLDNLNDYYDVKIKEYRLKELEDFDKFEFIKGNLADKELINKIFEENKPNIVVNLGAQAGVRYSITPRCLY